MKFKGASKQATPVKVTFNNLDYEISLQVPSTDPKLGKNMMKKTKILKNCSGYVLPG